MSLTATTRRLARALAAAIALIGASGTASAGSIFLTGHDPDFHALSNPPENPAGAQKINQVAISFITDPLFNAFVATAPKFLLVESKGSIPGGHRQGKLGIGASGYTEGVHFDHHDFTTLNAALDLLGDLGGYSAVVIASDFGGILRQAELDILNARSLDIIAFLNAGGGLYAMAESNNGAGLTPTGGHFDFLPFVVSSTAFNQTETGFTVTAFGASLGLTNSDVNGNFSHNIFTSVPAGLLPVDLDAAGNVMSVAGRTQLSAPEPNALALLAPAMLAATLILRRRRRHA